MSLVVAEVMDNNECVQQHEGLLLIRIFVVGLLDIVKSAQ